MASKKAKAKVKKDSTKGQPSNEPFVREQEQYLLKEHAFLTEQISAYTQCTEQLQEKNEFLNKENQDIRENSRVYLASLSKCTLRCQNATTTLNEKNCSDLAQVRKQKEQLISQYMDREKEVKFQLIELETKFSVMKKELKELQPVKELQTEQLTCIRMLEKQLLGMKNQHLERMHKVKSQVLQQKKEHEMKSQEKVEKLAKKAEKEAVSSLIEQTKQMKTENCQLRSELLNLIQRVRNLKAFMQHLHQQKEQLQEEHQYNRDLACMHQWLIKRGFPKGAPSGFTHSLYAMNKLYSQNKLIKLLPSLDEGPGLFPQESSSQTRPAKACCRIPVLSTNSPENT